MFEGPYVIVHVHAQKDLVLTMTVTTARVTLTFDPKDSHVFLDALRELWEQAKEEEDLLFFDVSESSTTPGTFHLIELWARDIDYLSAVRPSAAFHARGIVLVLLS